MIFSHQVFPDASTQKLQSLWTSILRGYYLRLFPSSTPSFVQKFILLAKMSCNSNSHLMASPNPQSLMEFHNSSQSSVQAQILMKLLCSKVDYQAFGIPNFSWFLKATPKQLWNAFERVEQSKIGHLSHTKLQLLADFMSKFRRAYLFYANKQCTK